MSTGIIIGWILDDGYVGARVKHTRNCLQAGLMMDLLVTPIDVALAMDVAWSATLETFARDMRASVNPFGLLGFKLCPKIIFYVAGCIAEGVFDFL
jgi:hypothetical protein